jgi:hypothetical protein
MASKNKKGKPQNVALNNNSDEYFPLSPVKLSNNLLTLILSPKNAQKHKVKLSIRLKQK